MGFELSRKSFCPISSGMAIHVEKQLCYHLTTNNILLVGLSFRYPLSLRVLRGVVKPQANDCLSSAERFQLEEKGKI
jgi:hypothetical protein